MNKPKIIGTTAESAVRNVCKVSGFPDTERIALHGFYDEGDVLLGNTHYKTIIEVKGGKAAECASDNQIVKWLGEAERERINAGAAIGVLVTKRKGIGPANAGRWWVHTYMQGVYVRLLLQDWLTLQKKAS